MLVYVKIATNKILSPIVFCFFHLQSNQLLQRKRAILIMGALNLYTHCIFTVVETKKIKLTIETIIRDLFNKAYIWNKDGT